MTEPDESLDLSNDTPKSSEPSATDRAEDLAFLCLEAMSGDRPESVEELMATEPLEIREQAQRLLRTLSRVGLGAQVGAAEPPDRIGPFHLHERIGAGTMGVVYRATREGGSEELCLKLLQPGLLPQRAARLRFRREIAALRGLDHPGICPILADGEAEGVPYLAMPFVAGRSLKDWLHRRAVGATPADQEELLGVLADVGRALHHAHEQGFVHRDVKPANVIVRPGGQPVLLDFGLARVEQSPGHSALTMSGGQVGTPAYMAPEQVAGRPDVDRRCDIYALGVVLYEGLTGRLPHEAPTRESLFRRILSGEVDRPSRHVPSLSKALDIVCLTALDREPSRRYRSAADFAADLDRVRSGRAPLARLPGRWQRTLRWARRNPLPSGLLLVSTVALSVVAILAQRDYFRSLADHGRAHAASAINEVQSDPLGALDRAWRAHRESAVPESLAAIQAALDVNQPEFEFAIPSAVQGGGEHVTTLAFRGDAEWLAAGAVDGSVLLWDLTKTEPAAPLVLQHGDGAVRHITWQPGATADLLLTSGQDGGLSAFSAATQKRRWRLQLQDAGPVAPVVSWSPDGELLLTGSSTGVELWSPEGLSIVRTAASAAVETVAWIDASTFAFAAASSRADSWSIDIIALGKDGEIDRLASCSVARRVRAIHPCPDPGRRGLLLLVSDSNAVSLWQPGEDEPRPLQPFPQIVMGAGWSPDGRNLFAAERGGTVATWTADGQNRRPSGSVDRLVSAVASPAENSLAVVGDVGDGILRGFDHQPLYVFGRRRVRGAPLIFSQDGRRFASVTRNHDIQVWRRFEPALPRLFEGASERVFQVAWARGGHEVVAGSAKNGSYHGSLRSWDVETGRRVSRQAQERGVLGLCADDVGERLLVCNGEGSLGVVRVLRRESGLWTDVVGPLERMCFHAQWLEGERVLFVDESEGVGIWRPFDGGDVELLQASHPSVGDGSHRWMACCATSDASTIWAGGTDGYLHTFQAAGSSYTEADPSWLGDSIRALHCLDDGSLLVGGANGLLQRRFQDGRVLEFHAAKRHIQSVDAAWVDGELLIASGDDSGLIVLWREDGQMVREILAFARGVNDLRFSPDGLRLLAGAAGGAVAVWPVRIADVLELAGARLRRAGLLRGR